MQSVFIATASLALLMGALCFFSVSYYVYLLIKRERIEGEMLLERRGSMSDVPVFDIVYGDDHGIG